MSKNHMSMWKNNRYYDGTIFEQANKVIFSQLKYSAYQMDKPWTAVSLCAKPAKQMIIPLLDV